MQLRSGQSSGGVPSPTRKFITTILLIFSLAGLMIGFAVGGLTSSKATPAGSTGPTKKSTQPVAQTTQTVSPTATPENIPLDPPVVTDYAISEVANGTTPYTLSAQPIDKSSHKPINAKGITCRFWITQNLDETKTALEANSYALLKNVNGFNQPFPQEIPAGVIFTAPTAQVQECAANGPTKWTYTLSSALPAGNYYIYILTDWKGIHFNWNARQIQVSH